MAKPLILISSEDLPYTKEERLKREVFSLESRKGMILRDREKAKRQQGTITMLEHEICYLQREIEIRERRRAAHAKFLQKRSERRAKRR